MIALIVAVDQDCGIGKDGNIPWHFTEDMKHFAKVTKNSTCIMGRNTYEDLAEIFRGSDGLLPNRECIVVTSKPETIEKATGVKSINDAVEVATRENIFFIGGRSIYAECLPLIDEAYITFIPGTFECDVVIDDVVQWVEMHLMMDETRRSEVGDLLFAKYSTTVPT